MTHLLIFLLKLICTIIWLFMNLLFMSLSFILWDKAFFYEIPDNILKQIWMPKNK